MARIPEAFPGRPNGARTAAALLPNTDFGGQREGDGCTLVEGLCLWSSQRWVQLDLSWAFYRTTLLEAKNGLETVGPISWDSRDVSRDNARVFKPQQRPPSHDDGLLDTIRAGLNIADSPSLE